MNDIATAREQYIVGALSDFVEIECQDAVESNSTVNCVFLTRLYSRWEQQNVARAEELDDE